MPEGIAWPFDHGEVAEANLTGQPIQPRFEIGAPNATFPDHDHTPSCRQQGFDVSFVSGNVLLELVGPELRPGCRRRRVFASVVPMPVAAMNKQADAVSWQNDVRRTGQPTIVQHIAKSGSVQIPPNRQFRPGILSTDTRHPTSAGCSVNDVSQGRSQDSKPSLTE